MTGIFSIITLLIRRKDSGVIDKINQQQSFFEREKKLKQELDAKEKILKKIFQDLDLLLVDTNIELIKLHKEVDSETLNKLHQQHVEIKNKIINITNEIDDITKEYQIVILMTEELRAEYEKMMANGK
nr:MAG TPA: hypothetical protein [Caudoviricetes sp.]